MNKPEALRLADALTDPKIYLFENEPSEAAAELRRLHALNQELIAAMQWFVKKQNYHDNGGDDGRELDTYEIAAKFLEKAEALIAKAEGYV